MFTKAIYTKDAPRPIGPYSPAVQLGDFVYVSGQCPFDPVSGELVEGGMEEQTYQALCNLRAVLAAQGMEMRHIVKTTVFVTDLSEFSVVNRVYASFFDDPYPARSCVKVAALPKGARIEIEAMAINTVKYERAYEQQSCSGCSKEEGECDCEGGCCCE